MEEFESTVGVETFVLPSAPKASRGPDVDFSQVPNHPPFTAYVANLPYELNDNDLRNFFRDIRIVDIRLTTDEAGRSKGYGCIDFEDRQSLLDALTMHETNLKGRPIRVSLSTASGDKGQRGRDKYDRDRDRDGPDRTTGDWRSARDRPTPTSDRNDRGGYRNGPEYESGSGRDSYGRSDRGGDRGGGFRDRGFERRREPERDLDSEWQRGPPAPPRDDRMMRSNRREYGSSFDNRNRSRYDDGGFDRRGGGGVGGGGRRSGDDWGRDSRDERDRYSSAGTSSRPSFSRGNSGERDDRDRHGGDRYERGPGPMSPTQPDDVDGQAEHASAKSDLPKERPRLKLLPRTKPPDAPAAEEHQASIFGGAKPVDTAAKEREIEERLRREEEEKQLRQQERERGQKDFRRGGSSAGDEEDRGSRGAWQRSESSEDDGHSDHGYGASYGRDDRHEEQHGRQREGEDVSEEYHGSAAPHVNEWDKRRQQHESSGPRSSSVASGSIHEEDYGGSRDVDSCSVTSPTPEPFSSMDHPRRRHDEHDEGDEYRLGRRSSGPRRTSRRTSLDSDEPPMAAARSHNRDLGGGEREGGDRGGGSWRDRGEKDRGGRDFDRERGEGGRGGRGGARGARGGTRGISFRESGPGGPRRMNSRDGGYQVPPRSPTSPIGGEGGRGRRGGEDGDDGRGRPNAPTDEAGKKFIAANLPPARREVANAVPAPPPAENVWDTRKKQIQQSEPPQAAAQPEPPAQVAEPAPPPVATAPPPAQPQTEKRPTVEHQEFPQKAAPVVDSAPAAGPAPAPAPGPPRNRGWESSSSGGDRRWESNSGQPSMPQSKLETPASIPAAAAPASANGGSPAPGPGGDNVWTKRRPGNGGMAAASAGPTAVGGSARPAPPLLGFGRGAKKPGSGGNGAATAAVQPPPQPGVPTPVVAPPPTGAWSQPSNTRRFAEAAAAEGKSAGPAARESSDSVNH